jgi:hypothetical protein
MKAGIVMLLLGVFAGAVTWLLLGVALVALAVGIVTFLFALLGGLCYASDIYAGESEEKEFGGRSVSGSWK